MVARRAEFDAFRGAGIDPNRLIFLDETWVKTNMTRPWGWDIEVGPVTGWRWLRDLGFTLQVPRPSHPKAADRPTRRRWKKT